MATQNIFRLESSLSEQCTRFDNYFEKFKSNLATLNLNNTQVNQTLKVVKEIMDVYHTSANLLLQENPLQFNKNFTKYSENKFQTIETPGKW